MTKGEKNPNPFERSLRRGGNKLISNAICNSVFRNDLLKPKKRPMLDLHNAPNECY